MIHEPLNERRFGTDHREIDSVLFGKGHESANIIGLDRNAFGFLRDTSVARRTPQFRYAPALGQGVDEGVFAPAATDDEDFHRKDRVTSRLASNLFSRSP